MRKHLPMLIFGVLILVFLTLIEISRPPELTWRDSFSRTEKIPYGSYLVFEGLKDLFPNQDIEILSQPIAKTADKGYYKNNDSYYTYFFIDSELEMDHYDISDILWLAAEGNTVFLAANTFSQAIMDSLHFSTRPALNFDEDSAKVTLYGGSSASHRTFIYPYELGNEYFLEVDTTHVQILGTNSDGRPNMLRQQVGDGTVYINLVPHAFTNYYMVDKTNYAYIEHAFSFLPRQHLLWDEYYKDVRRNIPQTSLRFILSDQSLRYAYYLMWASVLLFMIFQGRRIQRIIPVKKPLENTTLQFIDTVSRLYFQNGDHKNLAEKQIIHFKEHLRQQYGINTDDITSHSIELLSRRSGLPQQDLEKTFALMKRISSQEAILESELQSLNKEIEIVYQISR
ncbi:MAG: DUF4350 domain-containing protein [Calditrichia bacterium]